MSLKTLSTATGTGEEFRDVQERVALDLLEVLRDVLGPGSRLPEPLTDYASYGDRSVTVRDGENGRVELTATLTTSGAVDGYSARLACANPPGPAAGPVRMDFSEEPEEKPTITYVLPLIIRLRMCEERMMLAEDALERAGYAVDDLGSCFLLRSPGPHGDEISAVVETDPDSGTLVARGRDASTVREILFQAQVF